MTRLITYLLFLLSVNSLLAQHTSSKADSLQKILNTNKFKSETDKLKLLSSLTTEYLQIDLVNAEKIANEQIRIAKQQKDNNFLYDAFENLGQIFYYQGRNDTALYCYNKAYAYYKTLSDPERKFHVLNNIGNIYKNVGKFDSAIVVYNEVLKYYESVKNKEWESKLLANIGSLYYTSGNTVKAKEYMLKAIEIQRKLNDKSGLGVSLVNLMVFALNAENYDEGIKYGEEALKALKEVNKAYYAAALIRVGYCYYMKKNSNKAIEYTLEAVKINEENKSKVGMMESYRTLADYYVEDKQYLKAKNIGLKALQIADTTNRFELRHIYDLLKRVSIYSNEPQEAIKYSDLQIKVIEEFLNKDWAEKIAEADTRYQTEKKEKAILKLTAEKKTQRIFLYLLMSAFILGGFLVYFIIRSIKNKKTIAEQDALLKEKQIVELEKDRKLIATQSVLKGEETERSRVARDLHDGLGGLLSGVKLNLTSLKNHYVLSQESVDSFNNTLNLLDRSIVELRRVAHNMMPEALMKYGLKDALQDFCDQIAGGKEIKLSFSFFGEARRFDPAIETSLFRITQELVNNALKHSRASEIIVQFIQESNRVYLSVQDNGVGFDPTQVDITKSAGLQNIRARVESFKGRMDIDSQPQKGTEIGVEFKLAGN